MSRPKRSAKVPWIQILKAGLDADTWGQALEAIDEYKKLTRVMDIAEPELQDLTTDERGTMKRIKICLAERVESLQEVTTKKGVTIEEIKLLRGVLEDLFERPIKPFPIQLHNVEAANDRKQGGGSFTSDIESESVQEAKESGANDGAKAAKAGSATMSVFIDKIGLKDAQSYIEPHITVSVMDSTGSTIIDQEDTPKSSKLKPNYVTFGDTIMISTPLEEFKTQGYVLFFEFKHYKPKKKKISTRCYSFMDYSEIIKANGNPTCLELYKKPTDYTRKKVNLFTIKPLYIHLTITFVKH